MTRIVVRVNEHTTNSKYADEAYGDWYENISFSVESVAIATGKTLENAFDIGNVNSGDKVHVLWITYSTGDSFGYSAGNGEIVMVYKDLDVATMAKDIYNEHSDDCQITLPFETENGIEYQKIGNPASGYFESLDDISLDTFVVNSSQYKVH